MALQGLLANPEHREVDRNNHAMAEDAVRMANALVWALEQRSASGSRGDRPPIYLLLECFKDEL
ncbi:hypothetical protein IQ230_24675 [Gloeocapsopsis crepidinum LEGE 06123]|uniref:Uncharacterized protein n=1 Tax=Gloeocapsopsis crepidinum LEGE 06123 TaxID=588587 RepID=A0ABR9UYS0_9CHRO|nr:hypothetical protein [Gloeocapsopsis crepidinum]MBE9193474.1 hypothetical protein [Gloeocapsopsis crepidinum LEGE 06123]